MYYTDNPERDMEFYQIDLENERKSKDEDKMNEVFDKEEEEWMK